MGLGVKPQLPEAMGLGPLPPALEDFCNVFCKKRKFQASFDKNYYL